MQYAGGARDSPKQPCLEGTRTAVIQEITDWINLPNTEEVSRVFWLNGVAGSGKSAIALSFRDLFASVKRLGSAFFFDKNYTDRTPSKLFSTISRDIADLVPEWRAALLDVLGESHSLRTTLSVDEQWKEFMVKPARRIDQSQSARRVVIVIDAPDEFPAGSVEREHMLEKFALLGQLPSCFRVLITSRPDHDIQEALRQKVFLREKQMGSIDEQSTRNDIDCYAKHCLAHLRLEASELHELNKHADCHFQWMATACKFVMGKTRASVHSCSPWLSKNDWKKRLSVVISGSTDHLDTLYTSILKDAFGNGMNDPEHAQRVRDILGRILYLGQPISMAALQALHYNDCHDIAELLAPLSSLLQGVSRDDVLPIRPLHSSFRDFLMDRQRSAEFCVSSADAHHTALASMCFQTLGALCFNICGLKSSHLNNKNVHGLGHRTAQRIPSQLQYACVWWSYHLQRAQLSDDICGVLRIFLETKSLYWVEAASLLRETSQVYEHLSHLCHWAKVRVRRH